jgi:hypothetical protein
MAALLLGSMTGWQVCEVERLERGQVGERGEIAAELLAPDEVERLEQGEAFQLGRKSI